MKANELRIGNWLYSNLTKQNFQVNADDIEGINGDPSVCDPIPITEEWLVKLNSDNDLFYKFGVFELRYSNYSKSYEVWMNGKYILSIYYIHQLQNLYFVLTGKELII